MDNDKDMLNADGVEDETVGQQWLEQQTIIGLHKCGFKHLTIHQQYQHNLVNKVMV